MGACLSAISSTGLEPKIGFLHEERAGRYSLALDLMEEFRPLLADRLVLAIINRKQVALEDFKTNPTNGSVTLNDNARKRVIEAWNERKDILVTNPGTGSKNKAGLLIYYQAGLLAKRIVNKNEEYIPCVLRI